MGGRERGVSMTMKAGGRKAEPDSLLVLLLDVLNGNTSLYRPNCVTWRRDRRARRILSLKGGNAARLPLEGRVDGLRKRRAKSRIGIVSWLAVRHGVRPGPLLTMMGLLGFWLKSKIWIFLSAQATTR